MTVFGRWYEFNFPSCSNSACGQAMRKPSEVNNSSHLAVLRKPRSQNDSARYLMLARFLRVPWFGFGQDPRFRCYVFPFVDRESISLGKLLVVTQELTTLTPLLSLRLRE